MTRGRHRQRPERAQGTPAPAPSVRSARASSAYSPGRLLRISALLVATGTAAALTLPLGADAAVHRVVTPATRVHLPAAAEAAQPYVPQDSCDPHAKPGVVAFRALMISTYRRGSDGGIVRACSAGGTSEHKEGRAWDWMLNAHNHADAVAATTLLNWLIKAGPRGQLGWNARRFGIMYIIWDGRIWGAYRAADGWRPYVGASEHTDHIHFSFGWSGAMKRTSWWTGHVAAVDYGPCAAPGHLAPSYSRFNPRQCTGDSAPPPPPLPYAAPGQTSAHVLAVQKVLHIRPLSSFYGPRTTHAVALWQAHHHLAHTGVVDVATAVAMRLVAAPVPIWARPGDTGARVLAIQRALHVLPRSGYYGTRTAALVASWQRHHHLADSGVVDLTTARKMGLAPPAVLPAYAKPGDHGAHVVAVQRALRVRPVSGFYGAVTARAVAAWQQRHHLPHTGIVDAATARALRLH